MAALQQAQQAQQAASPEDAGKADVTNPASATDPNVLAAPPTAQAGAAMAREAVGRDGGAKGGEQEATPEEEAEYKRSLEALHTVLYANEGTSQAVVDMLQPEDKIGSTVKAGVMLIQQLDEKIDMDESVIAQITMDAADRLIEMGERAKGMQYSEKEAQAVLGATWEGVMDLFGVDEGSYEELTQGMSDKEIGSYEKEYKGYLGE